MKDIKDLLLRLIRLFIGFFTCASASVFMINANLGMSPWDVLHDGVSKLTGITIGNASIIVGVLFVILGVILGEKLGLGTVLNMIFIGKFIDFIMFNNLIPKSNSIIMGIVMLIIGMILMGIGCVLYIGSGLGCGPRDGIMMALSKKTGKPIKVIRTCLEIGALITGYFLGGHAGIGTIITAIGLGHSIQFVFKLFKFEGSNIKHKSIKDNIGELVLSR
ncbi:MAG: hypothetical protein RSB70_01610 [Clostridium sp.]